MTAALSSMGAFKSLTPGATDTRQMTRDELAQVLAELIRDHPGVHKALLDWAAFNPHIEFKF